MAHAAKTPPDFFSAQISEARRFYLDLQPPKTAGLAVVCGGCEHCTPDYAIQRNGFPYWSIEFVAQGRGTLVLAGSRSELVPGTVFSYGPGIAHDIRSDAEEPLIKYFVDFSGGQVKPIFDRYGPAPGTARQTSAPGEVMSLWDTLIREAGSETPFTPRITALLLEVLLAKLAETAMPCGSAASPAFATYRRCKHYLENHWSELRTLQQISAACHIDPSHLCRLFQRFDHQSPYHCLLRLKMNHAAKRLQTMASVKQVADEVGFTDAFHFSRVFKRVFGLAPSQFARLGER